MTESTGALADLRVLDVGGAMTAYCAKLLCELGAEVIVVEPPGGEELRRSPPWLDGRPGPEASLLFAHYRAGQRSVTLAAGSDDAIPVLTALAARADVVLVSPSERQPLAGWDAAAGTLAWGHPGLIVCAITHYGLTGPHAHRRATPQVSEAASGAMYRFGPPEGPPRALPGRQAWDETGAYGAFAVLAALHAREAVGDSSSTSRCTRPSRRTTNRSTSSTSTRPCGTAHASRGSRPPASGSATTARSTSRATSCTTGGPSST